MVEIYKKLEDYFLSIYDPYPQEIQKKMKNLLFINLLYLIAWILLFILDAYNRYFKDFNIVTLSRDFFTLGLIFSALLLIKLNKPLFAGYISMTTVLTLAIHPILMDIFYTYSLSEYVLYRTLCFLIIGELLISAYAVKRIQIFLYSIVSFIFIILHFGILMDIFYGGNPTDESYAIIFESIFLLIASTILSLFLFRLTFRSRMKIIKNIIFFKMGKKGPIPFFTEQSINYNSIIESGIYFYTAIGQGNRYRKGLFGPIPFGDEKENVALIFSSIVRDSDFEDPRLEKENYLMIALIAEEQKVNLIDRNKLFNLLEQKVNKMGDLSEIDQDYIQDFINSIRAR